MIKSLFCSLTSLCLVTNSALAEEKDLIQAQLLTTSITEHLPEEIDLEDHPHYYNPGAKLVFFFQVDNLISIDSESFFVADWDKRCFAQVSASKKLGSVTIYNRKFKGIAEELEVDGRVDIQVGDDEVTQVLTLNKDDKPIELPHFTVALNLDETNEAALSTRGVSIVGNYKMIQSVTIVNGDKEVKPLGYRSDDKKITYKFNDIASGDKVKIVYWSKLKTKSVKLYK